MIRATSTTFGQRADFVVEGEYHTGAQEQLYIENNGVIAIANPAEGVTVWGSMQCPYYVHKALVKLFGLPEEKIRVIQTETGGGFGGKEEYPSLIAGHAALLSWKSGKPVKMIYDRAEDMVATTKRHPSRTRHKTAVSKDGKLLAMEIEFIDRRRRLLHAVSGSPFTRHDSRRRSLLLSQRAHTFERALLQTFRRTVRFRGFGAPQSIFALERQMDKVARTVGLTPDEFRRPQLCERKGETTATSQVIREKVDMDHLLDRAFELTGYHEKTAALRTRESGAGGRSRRQEQPESRKVSASLRSCMARALPARAKFTWRRWSARKRRAEGRVRILAASTEIGQGTNTVFSQIAAEALGVDESVIEVAPAGHGRTFPTAGQPWRRAPAWWWANWWSRPCSV